MLQMYRLTVEKVRGKNITPALVWMGITRETTAFVYIIKKKAGFNAVVMNMYIFT